MTLASKALQLKRDVWDWTRGGKCVNRYRPSGKSFSEGSVAFEADGQPGGRIEWEVVSRQGG